VDPREAVEEVAPMTLEGVNAMVTELTAVQEQDMQDIYDVIEDTQDRQTQIYQSVGTLFDDSDKNGYIKNHKKTVKNKQARTRERKSEQKPEAKPGKVKPSVKVVKSWSTKVNKTQNIPFKPLNFQKSP
ncbi:hypothetical protein Tco_1342345, partial [Tanacetum coccineum]